MQGILGNRSSGVHAPVDISVKFDLKDQIGGL
jgi:hypothetical protein